MTALEVRSNHAGVRRGFVKTSIFEFIAIARCPTTALACTDNI
jgi:hypothetical protein